MSGHRPSLRYDVVAGTRRRFSLEQKRAIVGETETGARVCEVARRHNVHTSLLFRWRRQYASTTAAASMSTMQSEVSAAAFLPVRVEAPVAPMPARPKTEAMRASEMIEIELLTGRKLRVGADVDLLTLRRIIGVLETA